MIRDWTECSDTLRHKEVCVYRVIKSKGRATKTTQWELCVIGGTVCDRSVCYNQEQPERWRGNCGVVDLRDPREASNHRILGHVGILGILCCCSDSGDLQSIFQAF